MMVFYLQAPKNNNNICLPLGQAYINSLAETSKYPLRLNSRNTTLGEKPKSREIKIEPQIHRAAYTGDPHFHKASFRHCPYCKSKNCKRNGKDTKGRIRRKCKCGKSFTIDWKVWNLDKLFSELFEEGFNYFGRKSSIQYRDRIKKKILDNKKVQEYINDSIIETYIDKSTSDDARDNDTFIQACIMADKIDCKEATQHKDSWYFLLNKDDGDVTYLLAHYCYILIRKHNMDLFSRQNLEKPLLHCDKCGMNDISTYGFNNNARRRIKCNYCGKMSIIRVSNLISRSEFIQLCNSYLQGYTRDQNLIVSITQTLHKNFTILSKSRTFDKIMLRQPVITYSLKEVMFKAFIGIEIIRVQKRLNQSLLNYLIRILDLRSKIDNEGYLKTSKDTFYSWIPKHIDDILKIEHAKSEEDYKFKNIECEIAAHLHDSVSFYDWKSRSSVIYNQVHHSYNVM